MKDMLKKENKNSNDYIIKIIGGFIKQQPQEFQEMIMKQILEDDGMKVEGTQIEIHEEGKKILFKGSKKQQLQ
jgi:hypothetical protein